MNPTCPDCRSDGSIHVVAGVLLHRRTTDDRNLPGQTDFYWDDSSLASCSSCGWSGLLGETDIPESDKDNR